MQILQLPKPGDLVRVRRRRWRVADVRAHNGCHEVTLTGAGDWNRGTTRRVLAPFEIIESLDPPTRLRFVPPRRWRRACRALVADVSPPGGLRTARNARIDLLPHQLEPALAVVRGLGSRVLLADDVGLGKTIQAALVLTELRERVLVDRVLILTPASLRDQWATELAARFNVDATVVDAREVRRRLAMLPQGVNPWSTVPLAIVSVDYVKRPETLLSIGACRWDMLIVDEAHASAGESDRRAAVTALAARCPYVLLLTGTPHSGDARAFSSLCAAGAHADPLLVFRRSRQEVCLNVRRHIHRLYVRPSEAEDRMHALVADFSRAARHAWRRHRPSEDGIQTEERARWLALAVLNKRALSCARSLLNTVERRLASLAAAGTNHVDDPRQIGLPLIDLDGDTDDTDRPPELADLALDDPQRERTMLRELADAARQATLKETKIAALIRFLRRVQEPAIVFTEYRDTLLHLHHVLYRLIKRPAVVLHGGLSREQRAAALDDFVSARRSILLATDAAGEGLNLQQRCRIVINLELPWNPVRLEQRIGRVDRIGQRRTVHAFHLIAGGTAETRILERLRARIARAQADIAAADPIGPAVGPEVGSDVGSEVGLRVEPDDEAAIARWVVDGADTVSATTQNQESATLTHEPGILKPEPLNETLRLALARRFTFEGDEDALARLDAEGTWIARAACRATRMELGARVLFILKATLEDPAGRQVESALVPIAIDWPHGYPARTDLFKDALRVMAPAIVAHTEAPLAWWRGQAIPLARAFLDRRLFRERAIANLADRSSETFQAGLFDRRAEREHLATLLGSAEATKEAARRIAALEEARVLSVRTVRLLLVLAP